MPSTDENLKSHFLIAMPNLQGGFFAQSITYICEHDSSGAMGLVINQALDLCLDELLSHLDIEHPQFCTTIPIMAGGPVNINHGFVLHRPTEQSWESSLTIAPDIHLTSSGDILEAIAIGLGPENAVIALGYAGWGAGQLEEEMSDNCWLTLPADSNIIFDTPYEQRLSTAVAKLGIDFNLMPLQAGHA